MSHWQVYIRSARKAFALGKNAGILIAKKEREGVKRAKRASARQCLAKVLMQLQEMLTIVAAPSGSKNAPVVGSCARPPKDVEADEGVHGDTLWG